MRNVVAPVTLSPAAIAALDRCGTAPRGQQREVQIDPAAPRHGEQLLAEQRAVGHDGATVRGQRAEFVDELSGLGRIGRNTGMPASGPAARSATARACRGVGRRVRPGQHRHHSWRGEAISRCNDGRPAPGAWRNTIRHQRQVVPQVAGTW